MNCEPTLHRPVTGNGRRGTPKGAQAVQQSLPLRASVSMLVLTFITGIIYLFPTENIKCSANHVPARCTRLSRCAAGPLEDTRRARLLPLHTAAAPRTNLFIIIRTSKTYSNLQHAFKYHPDLTYYTGYR